MRHALDCGLCSGLAECDCMEKSMDEARATEILTGHEALSDDRRLYSCGWYLAWSPGEKDATLDGQFTADDLEAIAWWMRHKAKI